MNIVIPAGLIVSGALVFYAGYNTGRIFYGNTRLTGRIRKLETDAKTHSDTVKSLAANNASLRRQLGDCRAADVGLAGETAAATARADGGQW